MGKRHHYINKAYLKYFINPNIENPNNLFVYEKGNVNIKLISINDTAVKEHYYSIKNIDGTRDYTSFESYLNKLETQASPILKKLNNCEKIVDEEKKIFSKYIASFMTRVPNFIDQLKKLYDYFDNPKFKDNAFNELAQEFEDHEKLKEIINEKTPQNELDRISLLIIYNFIEQKYEYFYKMKWIFMKATPEYKFITSDNPLSWENNSSNIKLSMPLSPNVILLMSENSKILDKKFIASTNGAIKELNKQTIISAYKYIFASYKSENINKIVQKHCDHPIFNFKISS